MASRAASNARASAADWRAVLRRSLRRSLELIGGGVLIALLVFLALALVSYTQTDPSGSTASGSPVENWMGLPGAWAAERVLLFFGIPGGLLLPLLWVFARRLWDAQSDFIDGRDDEDAGPPPRWWWPTALLFMAMALIGTALSLWGPTAASRLPAGPGGLSGLLGATGIKALAELVPQVPALWFTLPFGLAALGGGMAIAARVFAFDWGRMLTLPPFLRRRPARAGAGDDAVPALPAPRKERREKEARATADTIDAQASLSQRKPTEISDASRGPAPAAMLAKARQGDLFDSHELPSIELLVEAAPGSAQKVDKLALERNARLLENVLDDFNVKGEITAVRTGPVVTMYELEPAPGIKASRVIGLSDDIARNMSAISARVSSIPGRTVMGIELPNAIRDMVSFRELIACEKFAASKAMLPIILGLSLIHI